MIHIHIVAERVANANYVRNAHARFFIYILISLCMKNMENLFKKPNDYTSDTRSSLRKHLRKFFTSHFSFFFAFVIFLWQNRHWISCWVMSGNPSENRKMNWKWIIRNAFEPLIPVWWDISYWIFSFTIVGSFAGNHKTKHTLGAQTTKWPPKRNRKNVNGNFNWIEINHDEFNSSDESHSIFFLRSREPMS